MTRVHTTFLIAFVAMIIAGHGVTLAVAQTEDVAVVVNSKNQLENLSGPDLRKIFAGEKRSWAGGLPIKLFVPAPGVRERAVLLKLLGMTETAYKQYWTAKVFRGEAQAEPAALSSSGMQKDAVAVYAGAILLVNFQDVTSGMKVLTIEGQKPGEAGYPLSMAAVSRRAAIARMDSSRKTKSMVAAFYPDLAQSLHLQGVVRVQVTVSASGAVTDANGKGHPLLVGPSLDAAKKWRFEPAAGSTLEVIEFRFAPESH